MYKASHKLSQLTEDDYREAAPLKDAAEAMSKAVAACIYVVDIEKRRFLYVSDCLLQHFDCQREEAMTLGTRLFARHISSADLAHLQCLDRAIQSAYRSSHRPDLRHEVLSIDVPMHFGGHTTLVHLKHIPLALDSENLPWLLLGFASRSPASSAGHIFLGNAKSRRRLRFVDNGCGGFWDEAPVLPLRKIEVRTLSLAAQGLSAADAAKVMHRSDAAIKLYRREAFRKLGANNLSQAIAIADMLCLI